MPGNHQERGSEPTRDEVVPMLGEARMVVPGIQSLFGFQLIAVFTEGFRSLDAVQRLLHFTSLLATLIAIGLIMSPAAHHRLAEEWAATARFMRISSRLIALAMIALMDRADHRDRGDQRFFVRQRPSRFGFRAGDRRLFRGFMVLLAVGNPTTRSEI